MMIRMTFEGERSEKGGYWDWTATKEEWKETGLKFL